MHIAALATDDLRTLHTLKQADAAWGLNLTEREHRLFSRFHAMESVAFAPEATLEELLSSALRRLLATSPLLARELGAIVFCRGVQVHEPFPAKSLENLKREYALGEVPLFSLSQSHCATGIVGLDVAATLVEASKKAVLLLTGEKCFVRELRVIPGIALHGEGAVACLLRPGPGHHQLQGLATRAWSDYRDEDFVPNLGSVIAQALQNAGVGVSEITAIIPHNLHPVALRKVARGLGLADTVVYQRNVRRLGHASCSDVFINLETALAERALKSGDRYVLACAGVANDSASATCAAAVFQY